VKKLHRSHGTGVFDPRSFKRLGDNVVFESGVLVFHPETIEIDENVYIGHQTILKGYYLGSMKIGSGTWIGQQAFFHSAGTIEIGRDVGIGPGVKILTSAHDLDCHTIGESIMEAPLKFAAVLLEDGCDIGAGAIILPGVRIGKEAQVGAGAVVTRDVAARAVVVGVPARVLRHPG
jgi:acetyltransferase-like isoleucine patch superfamily enzyme